MAFNKPYLPDYFDESALSKDDKELITNEKALQKALSKGDMQKHRVLTESCEKGWRKYLNTDKMKQGQKLSEKSYWIAVHNLKLIKG